MKNILITASSLSWQHVNISFIYVKCKQIIRHDWRYTWYHACYKLNRRKNIPRKRQHHLLVCSHLLPLLEHAHVFTILHSNAINSNCFEKNPAKRNIHYYYCTQTHAGHAYLFTHASTFVCRFLTILSFLTSIKLSYGRFKIIRARIIVYMFEQRQMEKSTYNAHTHTSFARRKSTQFLSLVTRINYIWFHKLDK